MTAEPRTRGPTPIRHLPDVDIACRRVEPEDIAGPITVEVSGPARRIVGRMGANADTRCPLAVRDFPQINVAGGRVEPEHVAGAAVIVVAKSDRLISCGM